MSEGRFEEIAALLQEGLDAYGEDEVGRAIAAWRKVLAIDPDHTEALDFIQTADRRSVPREESVPERKSERARDDAWAEARRQLAKGELEEALELLSRSIDGACFSLEREATIELVRSALYRDYLVTIGDLTGVPVVMADASELTKHNLPANAGFLLSLLDGVTDLENLVTVSGMDSFEALRTTRKLIDVGLVEMQPSAASA
ncbi:MAG: hypothetical protein QF570_11590 [Myxococcota bacterium]|jgi:hypothetical protein|nr:hypothetical protein [Myxococcota bacterium]